MKRETGRWVRKAEADHRGARKLHGSKPPVHDLVCFHCQQSAEKYLKALLQEFGVRFPRTHILDDLVDLLLPHDPTVKVIAGTANRLTKYAVDYRYPEEDATKRQATAALRDATRIRQEIRIRLRLRT